MATDADKDFVRQALDSHLKSVEVLHATLKKANGVNQEKLAEAMDKHKDAVHSFHDDALGCMN